MDRRSGFVFDDLKFPPATMKAKGAFWLPSHHVEDNWSWDKWCSIMSYSTHFRALIPMDKGVLQWFPYILHYAHVRLSTTSSVSCNKHSLGNLWSYLCWRVIIPVLKKASSGHMDDMKRANFISDRYPLSTQIRSSHSATQTRRSTPRYPHLLAHRRRPREAPGDYKHILLF